MLRLASPVTALGALALLLSACGPKQTAGEAVRPKELSAGEALRGDGKTGECSASDDDRTLIVDLAPEDRKDLENMLRQGKVPVVSYDCASLKLLRRCSMRASFEYLGASPRKNVRSIENQDAISAEVPLASAKLRASVSAGRKVDIALAEVGTRSASFELVARAELEGVGPKDCEAATHFVRAADIGAFAIAQRTSGEAAAAAQIFTAGGSGDSKSAMSSMNSEGKLDTCEQAKESDKDAPEGCRVPLRLHLRRLVADAKEKEAKEQEREREGDKAEGSGRPDAPCPTGKVRAEGGSCVAPSPNIRFQCRSGELEECKQQCEKGHAGSCERLGGMLLYGSPPNAKVKIERDAEAAISALEKACDMKRRDARPVGCVTLASAYKMASFGGPPKPGQPPRKPPTEAERRASHAKASAVLEHACKALDGYGCYALGREEENGAPGGGGGDVDRALHHYKRACSLGHASGCLTAARLYVEGKRAPDGSEAFKKSPTEGLAILDASCQSGSTVACGQLATYLTTDKYKVKDVPRAAKVFKGLCEKKSLSGCAEHALLQLRGEGGVAKDPKAARETLEKLCYDAKVAAACYGVGLLKESGDAGVTKDEAKAAEYFKTYAYVKDAAARAARLYERGGKGLPKDEDAAAQLFSRACTSPFNSDASACTSAAGYAEGSSSAFRARQLYDQACRLGDKGACAKAKALKPRPPGPPPSAPPGKK